jgi:malate/lactate dehydrogenase
MTGSAAGTTKIAIVGAGSVGATAAYACLIRGIGRTIAIYDINADKTRAEVLAWDVPGRPPLDAAAREEIHRRVVGSAGEIIRGKGATNDAVGLATARIVEAVLRDQRQVLPSPLSEEEAEGLRRSAETVKGVIGRLAL